ncbi:MAG TPA: ABC transporter substrate-binding protein [Micromonosporaceae bacterium]|nr:ABC transporter substrate-binding protein [Micromonosporaceae bacterium]
MNRRHFAALLLVASLAACTQPATPAPGAPVSVRLGFSAWPGWFPWQVAEEQGLFAKNNLTVNLTYFDSYTDSLTALATGNLDANSQTLNDTLSSVSGGAKQTIVLVNDNSTGNDQIIARDGISSVADLKGKKVAAEQGTVDHYLLLLALERAGLSEADIQFTPLLTDAAAAAFAAGQVDAVGVFAPFTTAALGRPGSRAIATSKDFPGAIPDHLVFGSAFVRDHPTEVQALVQTWFDTLDWIKANPDRAIDIMAAKAGVTSADYRTYDSGTTIFTRADNLAAFSSGSTPANLDFQAGKIADFLVGTKLVATKPSLDGLLDDRFVKAAAS